MPSAHRPGPVPASWMQRGPIFSKGPPAFAISGGGSFYQSVCLIGSVIKINLKSDCFPPLPASALGQRPLGLHISCAGYLGGTAPFTLLTAPQPERLPNRRQVAILLLQATPALLPSGATPRLHPPAPSSAHLCTRPVPPAASGCTPVGRAVGRGLWAGRPPPSRRRRRKRTQAEGTGGGP